MREHYTQAATKSCEKKSPRKRKNLLQSALGAKWGICILLLAFGALPYQAYTQAGSGNFPIKSFSFDYEKGQFVISYPFYISDKDITVGGGTSQPDAFLDNDGSYFGTHIRWVKSGVEGVLYYIKAEGGINMSTSAGDNVGSNGTGASANTLGGNYTIASSNGDSKTAIATTRWNVTKDNIGVTQVKLYINKLNRRGSSSPRDEHNVWKDGPVISVQKLGNLKITGHTFPNKNNATLSWTSDNNEMSKQSTTKLYRKDQLTNTLVATSNKGTTSGSFTVPQSDDATVYYLEQEAYDGRISLQSADYSLPAFTHPTNIEAKYNITTNKVDVSWEIPASKGSSPVNASFILQRATKSNFSDSITIRTEPFVANKTSYSYADSLKTNVYYRVYRNYGTGWNMKDTVTYFYGAHAAITDASNVRLKLSQDQLSDTLRWNVGGIWSQGASFIINRINKGTGVSTTITLSKEDYEKGMYVDDLITPCNEYYYTLQVKTTDNSGYPTITAFRTTTIKPVIIGTIADLKTSKGYYPDRVSLEWDSKGSFDNYIIQRRVYGSNDNFVQIATVQGGATTTLQTDDERGQAGIYYEYRVVGAVNCNNEMRYSADTLYAIGFRSPTGTIYGRITFPDGQAVENVAVRLESSDNTQSGRSILLDGSANSYLKIDSLNKNFSDTAFTVETWIKPTDAAPASQVIFSRNNQYELGFDAAGKLYFQYKNNTVNTTYSNPDKRYIHVAGVHKKDSLLLYVNGERKSAVASAFTAASPDKSVYIGAAATGKNFKGNIDEMRVWNTALDSSIIARDFSRLMGGGENNLAAYWRFDETINNEFYDVSYSGSNYNRNDGKMNAALVKRSADVPLTSQLSLKGYTDLSGNYMISGVPYFGNGTTYAITPLMGTHQFEPATVNRLVSSGANTFTVDFSDKSFFPVQGYVYYRNSTVPVSGVSFQIDGRYAQTSSGSLIQTDEQGRFEISVPVGVHEVKAIKANHIFDNDGKITDRHGNDLNYQSPISQRVLYDNTTVRFIGRVAGGTVEGNKPLGHSISKNNLGEELKVTLQLSGAQNRKINNSGKDSTVAVNHFLPSDKKGTQPNTTSVTYKDYSIEVMANTKTGEFFADLIPEVFNVVSVSATGHDDLVGNNPVALDLTNKFVVEKNGRSWIDSTQNQNGSWTHKNYTDSVSYNASYRFIKRNSPDLSIVQLDRSDRELSYFGDTTYSITLVTGAMQPIKLYEKSDNSYLFGYPVWQQGMQYNFGIQSFENYPYFTKADLKNPFSTDKVPSQAGLVSIVNDLKLNASAAPDTLSLDSLGRGIYRFIAGEPELSDGIGRKGFSATIQIGSQNIAWNGGKKKEGYLMGGRKTGSDFVTAGPDAVMWVLRDPPGANSYSWIEKGTTFTRSSQVTRGAVQSGDITLDKALGGSIKTWTGVGAGVIKEIEIENHIGVQVSNEEQKTFQNETTVTTTFLTNFSSSSAPDYVGAGGDLFIGNSTNIDLSQTLDLRIVDNNELLATDQIFYDGRQHNLPYSILQRDGINIAQKYGTLFAYPQKHIENILIPKLKEVRNSILLPNTVSEADAQARANNLKEVVYVSKLDPSNVNFGKSNIDIVFGNDTAKLLQEMPSYEIFIPGNPTFSWNDTIVSINNNIKNWEERLADNEKTKLDYSNKLLNNYSFTGGSSVTESLTMSGTKTNTQNFNIVVGGGAFAQFGIKADKSGLSMSISETAKAIYDSTKSSTTENTKTFGFQLSENGSNYISVDVLRAPDSSYVFRTKGGQTACPYQGAVISKYYNPGTIIDQPTIQVEKPNLTVVQPVVSNVPSNKAAAYTLKMSNDSEAKQSATFEIKVLDYSNPNGAKIYLDGTELGRGRVISVPYGDVLTKTLTLERGPDSMDYRNIQIVLQSECDAYLIESVDNSLADTISISAHFIPSCSYVNIKAPTDKWTLNTLSQRNGNGNRYLPVTIDGFDVNQSLFDHIALQYKPNADANWITVTKFYGNKTKFDAADGAKQMITENGVINYNLIMTDAAFSDQNYNVRAVGYCIDNGQVIATSSSEIINGIKDTYNPRLFGSPQPANGVLGIGDNIQLNFNEQIAQGLLSVNDFQVTGVRNGAKGDHSVAVTLNGSADYIASEFSKNLTGKNITAELWVLPDGQKEQTIFSQGNSNNALEMAFTADNHLQITVGNKTIKSNNPVNYQPGEWAHVALKYNAANNTVAALYNFVDVIHETAVDSYDGSGHFEFGRSIKSSGNYFAGKMHEARVWSALVSNTNLQVNSLQQLTGYENALLAYYPMNEGRGKTVFDKAHGANAKLLGNWLTPDGRSLLLKGDGYVKANAAYAPITKGMDYTMELWFKSPEKQTEATLLSNGRGDATDFESDKKFNVGFEGGKLTFTNNGFTVQADGDYHDNQWHQLALTVNRNSGVAQLYIDGKLNKYFDANNLGSIESPDFVIGARANLNSQTLETTYDRYFKGNIDEVRIWNTYLNQELINRNSNVRLAGDELGLLAYYPFEKYYVHQNNKELDTTLSDMKVQKYANVTVPIAKMINGVLVSDKAPIVDRGPVANLQFDYVVNNDKLIINLLEPKQAIDKTIVTLRADNVRDMNGNPVLSPITWTAYINQNRLKWSENELNLSKDVYKPLQFEAYVMNVGGNLENFRLSNVPRWLKASAISGTIDPLGRQLIKFTVDEGLNVGSYDEVIYMTNDNNEVQSLTLNLKVKGKEPDWKVNPADFKYNMNVYGKMRFNNIFSTNTEDMLAAFENGKCVGVARSQHNEQGDMWYTFLTVYSNNITHNNLEFRMWEANTGKVYAATPAQAVNFANDAVAGTVGNPIVFDGKEMQYQDIELKTGWNWISFNLSNASLNNVNATLINGRWQSGDIVKDQNGFDQYSGSNGWVGTMPAGFNNTSMYMLRSTLAQSLSVSGTRADLRQMPLTVQGARWNYISYLPAVNMTVKEALAGYDAQNEDVIKSQTGFAMYDAQRGWVGNLTYMEPGKGYMLYRKASGNVTFTYPSSGGSLTTQSLAAEKQRAIEKAVASYYSYADNMTMVAKVEGFALQGSDKVLAYVGGELRGQATILNDLLYLNIAGNSEMPLTFAVERNGKVVAEAAQAINYTSNLVAGTPDKPYVIKLNVQNAEITAYPNPFREQLTVKAALPGNGTRTVQLTVYDLSGKIVYSRTPERVTGSSYNTVWDGRTNGRAVAPGIYIVQLEIDGVKQSVKVVKQ